MTILDRILESKRLEVAALKEKPNRVSFKEAITNNDNGISLIAEVKKASPSKGVIREHFDPVSIAQSYVSNGAAAISVLTDEPFFQGSNENLLRVRETIEQPILRKEFIIDPVQVYETKWLGADALLLIVAALSDDQLSQLLSVTRSLNMDALVEVHTAEELDRALEAGADIIGVNNRNLKTFETSLDVSIRLATAIPDHVVKVSESGIRDHADLLLLAEHGFDAVLVGEVLAKQDDVDASVRQLLGKAQESNDAS